MWGAKEKERYKDNTSNNLSGSKKVLALFLPKSGESTDLLTFPMRGSESKKERADWINLQVRTGTTRFWSEPAGPNENQAENSKWFFIFLRVPDNFYRTALVPLHSRNKLAVYFFLRLEDSRHSYFSFFLSLPLSCLRSFLFFHSYFSLFIYLSFYVAILYFSLRNSAFFSFSNGFFFFFFFKLLSLKNNNNK